MSSDTFVSSVTSRSPSPTEASEPKSILKTSSSREFTVTKGIFPKERKITFENFSQSRVFDPEREVKEPEAYKTISKTVKAPDQLEIWDELGTSLLDQGISIDHALLISETLKETIHDSESLTRSKNVIKHFVNKFRTKITSPNEALENALNKSKFFLLSRLFTT